MTRTDRRSEILEAIAQLVRLSAEGQYDQLIVKMEIGRAYSGTSSCKIVKGVAEPLDILNREVDELNMNYQKR